MAEFDRQKYRVYKQSHIQPPPWQSKGLDRLPLDPDSYAVIRRDDLLGTAVLWQYVIAARQLLALADLPGKENVLTPAEREALQIRAEGFADLATEWGEERLAKIPD